MKEFVFKAQEIASSTFRVLAETEDEAIAKLPQVCNIKLLIDCIEGPVTIAPGVTRELDPKTVVNFDSLDLTDVVDIELKPCPWCGAKPMVYVDEKGDIPSWDIVIECRNMDCPVESKSVARSYTRAAINWNERWDSEEKDCSDDHDQESCTWGNNQGIDDDEPEYDDDWEDDDDV